MCQHQEEKEIDDLVPHSPAQLLRSCLYAPNIYFVINLQNLKNTTEKREYDGSLSSSGKRSQKLPGIGFSLIELEPLKFEIKSGERKALTQLEKGSRGRFSELEP